MFYSLARSVLFQVDPEWAHSFGVFALESLSELGMSRLLARPVPECPREVMGRIFPNPVGLAAGFDKDGAHVDALGRLGFGHIEVGTVTPRAQPGNPRPRVFRIPKARALINRMGFNNQGVDALVENLQGTTYEGIIGVSIGKNADTPLDRAVEDYLYCMQKVYPRADYIAINISSPNTEGLRELQHGVELTSVLAAMVKERQQLARIHGRFVPLAAKISPDLTDEQLAHLAHALSAHGVEAVIATNTTVLRPWVNTFPMAQEKGGLSGAPLGKRSTEVVRKLRQLLPSEVAIVGVGGIFNAADAAEKIEAGADLVQIYTGLIYRGPDLVHEIVRELCK